MKALINISGGAIKFIGLIACFRKIVQSGIKPKAVSGVSSGAIIALFYVCNKLDEAYELAKKSHDKKLIFSRKNDPERLWNIIKSLILRRNYLGQMDNLEKNIRSIITQDVFNQYKSDLLYNPDCYILSVREDNSAKVLVNLKYLSYEAAISHVIASSSIAPLIKSMRVAHKSSIMELNDGGHRDHSAGSEVLKKDSFEECITIFSRPSIEDYQEMEVGKTNNFLNRLMNFTIKTFNKEVSINDESKEYELCKKSNCEYSPIHLDKFVDSTYDITQEEIKAGIIIGEKAALEYLG
jgi:predicted acylesterase/phospholipase RssA